MILHTWTCMECNHLRKLWIVNYWFCTSECLVESKSLSPFRLAAVKACNFLSRRMSEGREGKTSVAWITIQGLWWNSSKILMKEESVEMLFFSDFLVNWTSYYISKDLGFFSLFLFYFFIYLFFAGKEHRDRALLTQSPPPTSSFIAYK